MCETSQYEHSFLVRMQLNHYRMRPCWWDVHIVRFENFLFFLALYTTFCWHAFKALYNKKIKMFVNIHDIYYFIFKYVGHSHMHVNGVHVTIINGTCNGKTWTDKCFCRHLTPGWNLNLYNQHVSLWNIFLISIWFLVRPVLNVCRAIVIHVIPQASSPLSSFVDNLLFTHEW